MKYYYLGLVLGVVMHMLYLDVIILRQHEIIDNCPVNEQPDKNGELPCLRYGNDTYQRFYGKYFGIYTLVKWNNVVTGKWRPE